MDPFFFCVCVPEGEFIVKRGCFTGGGIEARRKFYYVFMNVCSES